MSQITQKNNPCPSCGSSDALQIYDDGTGFCFSCSRYYHPDQLSEEPMTLQKKKLTPTEIETFATRGIKDRRISRQVAEFYDVKTMYTEDGEPSAYAFKYDTESWKIRNLPKDFYWINKTNKLFGQDKFNGGGKRLIICEGEIDTLSVAQANYEKYNRVYPVVGIASSTQTKAILENRDWVRSFNEVVICFDEDEAGKKAQQEAIRIIGFDKAKIVKLPENDANDVLLKQGGTRLMQAIFDASYYKPTGIIGKEDVWEQLVVYNSIPSIPYPPCLAGVNSKTKGFRLGEITLFISGTGSGKSTVVKEVVINQLLENPDAKIGIVSLEESPAETARKLAGMAINRNPADQEISLEDLKEGFDQLYGDDRLLTLDHQGSFNDSSIVDKLEYLCLTGCTYICIDHITILVSEGVEGLNGNEAIDKMMNNLARLVKRYPVHIDLVSHLRKTPNSGKSFEEGVMPSLDDIRGSGSIKQVSFDIIAFTRNMLADTEVERNYVKVAVLKCRHTGLTGYVPGMRYDFSTGRMLPVEYSGDYKEEFVDV
jgi:twinkle protein